MRSALLALVSLILIGSGAQAAGPDGLYLMTRMWSGSFEMRGWYFKNGQVSNEPRGELEKFDFKAAAAASPGTTGSYTVSGDSMTIKTADGKQTTAKYEAKDKGCFYWNGGLFCPARPFDKGAKLDGVFTGGASVSGAASAMTLTLSANGQYKLTSAGSATTRTSQSTATVSGQGAQSGTYELSGTQLVLKPSEGQPRKVLVFQYDDGSKLPMPHRMFFDGGMLKRSQ